MSQTTVPTTDPSLSLLTRIADEALNPGYQARPPGRRRGSGVATLAVLTVAGLLVSVLVAGSRQQTRAIESERRGLVEIARQEGATVDDLEAAVTELDEEVSALREAALGSELTGAEQAETISRMSVVAATVPIVGSGARVVVSDADPASAGDLGRVLDIDLQQVVNGLWEAGAEAVAVNGERVGPLTAIRSVQEVVLVNYDPVVSPYEVLATGDPRTLATDFLRSSGGRWLQAINLSAGIGFTIDAVTDDVLLPGQPVGTLRYAAPVKEPA